MDNKKDNKALIEAYHNTAIDFATSGDNEMYEFFMNKMTELSKIPVEMQGKQESTTKELVEIEEKKWKKFIEKLRNNIF